MYTKVKNIAILLFFLIFIFFISKYYFSEKNIKFVNKSRSSYALTSFQDDSDLPLLKNDTNDVIVYQNGLEEFKKKRKTRIWEKLISNFNE